MYPHHYPMYAARGPRRFLWFVLGGVAATLWLKSREREGRGIDFSRGWHACRPRGAIRESESRDGSEGAWAEERERFARIGAQASDTVADVSETALDSILTTVEALRTKLAEQRVARQRIEEERKKEAEIHRV